jgi:hypothetical protein
MKQKSFTLKKPITIPAGTVFNESPSKRVYGEAHYETTIGLSDNTYGTMTYCIGDDFDIMANYFEENK